jgi:glycosyltransferase involved in cell wall biosynthesis
MEGFPNVFIEAWACGIPVYSLNVDPGGVIEREGLGVIAKGNPDVIIKAMDEHQNTFEFAEKARTYIKHNHSMSDTKVEEINEVFTNLRYGKKRVLKKIVL